MNLKELFITLILSLVFLAATPVKANAATVSDISKELICQCGCTAVLSSCTHAECNLQEAMTTLIKQKVDQGQTGEEIIQSFVAQYGEQVLASPPKKGFNLTAWILPFAAILAGGGLIYVALKKWVKRGKQLQTRPAVDVDERGEEYKRRLEKELQEFTERGFR